MDKEEPPLTDTSSEDNTDYEDNKDMDTYTVTDIFNYINNIVHVNFPKDIKVTGEVSTAKLSKGHLYMTLKDGYASLNVVSWSHSDKVPGPIPSTGDSVTIVGKMTTYKGAGRYQLLLKDIHSDGIGKFHAKYLKTKTKYEKNGYFDEKNKKPMPKRLVNIGIISALTGAAIKDVLHVLQQNNFSGNVFIKGCNVQGPSCPASVAYAIKKLDKFEYNGNKLDAIIVTRGGGSIEDLMGYSDPEIIEAIHKAKCCIISAVGHEIDNMLSDYVADIRAATPSMAGEIVAKHKMDEMNSLINKKHYLTNTVRYEILNELNEKNDILTNLLYRLNILEKSDENLKLELKMNIEQKRSSIMETLNSYHHILQQFLQRIDISNPEKVLDQGYIIAYDSNGNIIKSINELNNKTLKLKFIDGYCNVKVLNKEYE